MSNKKNQNGNGHLANAAAGIAENKANGRVAACANETKLKQQTKENKVNRIVAAICVLYLLGLLVFFGWQLFDTWIGQHRLLGRFGYKPELLNTTSFRLVAFTVIGGGLGGVVKGIRSMLKYNNGFKWQYMWKYVAFPWMGAPLALFVYALLRTSITVLGGTTDNIGTAQILPNFAAGILAGYGAKDVFIWLDDRVRKIFQVSGKVPNVTGKPKETAEDRLNAADYELGEVSTVRQKNGKREGTVIDQSPPPGAPLVRGESVDIAIAASRKAE